PNYFVVTTAWLDYALRMLGLRPLEVAYIGSPGPGSVNRVAALCRSEPWPCPLDRDDRWAGLPDHEALFGLEAGGGWEGMRSEATTTRHTRGPWSTALSLYDAIAESEPYPFTVEESRLRFDSTM